LASPLAKFFLEHPLFRLWFCSHTRNLSLDQDAEPLTLQAFSANAVFSFRIRVIKGIGGDGTKGKCNTARDRRVGMIGM
jgi:hypothetical protein